MNPAFSLCSLVAMGGTNFWSVFVILSLAAAAVPAQNSNSTDVVLSRQKRNYGGKEPIDFPKAFNAVFGPPGVIWSRSY